MNERRWKTTWCDQHGYAQEYIFTAPESRVLARLDLQLALMKQGRPVPHTFELDVWQPVVGVVPNSSTGRS